MSEHLDWLNHDEGEHDHQKMCCRACGTHASPHVGCILR